MNEFVKSMETLTGLDANIIFKIALSIFVVVFIQIIRFGILSYVSTHTDDSHVKYRWRKITSYVAALLYFLVLGRIWFDAFSSISSFLGLAAAGIAIALRDPLVNLVGWFFILWRHPFRVGDRIQIGDIAGDVIDQRLFMFTILEIQQWVDADQSTGRVRLIPNGYVFTRDVSNYTMGFPFIWDELQVALTFESDWEKAKEILLHIGEKVCEETTEQAKKELDKANNELMIIYRKLTPIVYVSVKANGVVLSLRYLSPARGRRGIAQHLWQDILREFSKQDAIEFAYQTTRLTRTGGKVRDIEEEL